MAKIVEVAPDTWLARGETASTANRKRPLAIWGGIVGERGKVRIVHRGQNQDQGVFLETDTPSPHRVAIPCERYDPCGGCPQMHLDAEGQQHSRTSMVRMALNGEGLKDVAIEGWHASPDGDADFRHVVKLGFGFSHDGTRVKIGAWGRRDRRIVPIPKCKVASPGLRRAMVSLAHHIIEMGIQPYDPETDRGVLRAAVLRQSRSTGEIMVTLVAGRRPRKLNDLAETVAQAVGEIVGMWVHISDEPGNTLFRRDEEGNVGMYPLIGKDWIEEDLDGIGVRIGPGDFFQTNPAMALALYNRTLERLDPGPEEAFVDLYCGVGGLTLLGAKRCGLAIGIEGVAGAVKRAREAARRNRLSAEFVCGLVEEELPAVAARLKHPVVAVDPARRGLAPSVREALIAMGPRKLAYISCNAKTFARDLAAFQKAGATIGPVELFDMFPHTNHVECLTVLDFGMGSGRAPKRKLIRG